MWQKDDFKAFLKFVKGKEEDSINKVLKLIREAALKTKNRRTTLLSSGIHNLQDRVHRMMATTTFDWMNFPGKSRLRQLTAMAGWAVAVDRGTKETDEFLLDKITLSMFKELNELLTKFSTQPTGFVFWTPQLTESAMNAEDFDHLDKPKDLKKQLDVNKMVVEQRTSVQAVVDHIASLPIAITDPYTEDETRELHPEVGEELKRMVKVSKSQYTIALVPAK